MPSPKKELPNHAGGLYEVEITIGKTFEGKIIFKFFYSSISKANAREQTDAYKIEEAAAKISGVGFDSQDTLFRDWAKKWLETYKKGKVKDNTYDGTYRNPVEHHLIPYFGDAKMDNIRPVDIQSFF